MSLGAFICGGCRDEKQFPSGSAVITEAPYGGGLRADVGVFGFDGKLSGVVEVIDQHPPTVRALSEQGSLDSAYYRLLNLPSPPKRRSIDHEIAKGRFRYSDVGRNENGHPVWLCSADCLAFFEELRGADRTNDWDAPRCDVCRQYLHDNQLSRAEFRDWAYDPYIAYCIHCAARCDAGEMQWRAPGELAGGDPREWTPDEDADTTALFLAYCEAAFWTNVWLGRVAKLGDPDTYIGGQHGAAEHATARRVPMVNAAFDAGEWAKGANLLLPVGASGWAAYEDEPERLLAFGAGNCRGTAAAWERLLSHRLLTLPEELGAIIKYGATAREKASETQHCDDCGMSTAMRELDTGSMVCTNCGVLYG